MEEKLSVRRNACVLDTRHDDLLPLSRPCELSQPIGKVSRSSSVDMDSPNPTYISDTDWENNRSVCAAIY